MLDFGTLSPSMHSDLSLCAPLLRTDLYCSAGNPRPRLRRRRPSDMVERSIVERLGCVWVAADWIAVNQQRASCGTAGRHGRVRCSADDSGATKSRDQEQFITRRRCEPLSSLQEIVPLHPP